MNDAEYGRCEVCGEVGNLMRTYYEYNVKCECHSPNHFEIVRHCPTCTPKEPRETKITLSTSKLERINRR